MHAPRPQPITEAVAKSKYFAVAAMLHLVLFAMIGSMVIVQSVLVAPEIPDNPYRPGQLDGTPPVIPPDPQPPVNTATPTDAIGATPSLPSGPTGEPGRGDLVGVTGPGDHVLETTVNFGTYRPAGSVTGTATGPGSGPGDQQGMGVKVSTNLKTGVHDLKEVAKTRMIWSPEGSKSGPQGTGVNTRAKFVVHVAKYAAETRGDWHSTFEMNPDGTIRRGSIPNLLRQAKEWSRGRLQSETVLQPLDLASGELLEKRPPFVFFHGHADFKLTEAEVENLRTYLLMGGAVWADACLAGRGSRFDVAFRREIKRVVPDADKNLAPAPLSHEIYGGPRAFFQLGNVPVGMNYYQEPIEVLEINGLTAVIYTSNDYSDMMRIPLLPGTEKPDTRRGADRIALMPFGMWHNRGTLYRNFEAPTAVKAYQLGINITVHLLTRFDRLLETYIPDGK
ncbi:hypothetical protein DB346_05015 [Verrucomicrobia bacterium LW23]|nr:hypothetical protein DB346_05015 [Verrucomicrobia bacterium LW23]